MQWQIVEKGMMTEEDYDTIIDKGWKYFFVEYCQKYLGNALEEAQYHAEHAGNAIKKFEEAGIVILTEGAFAPAPYEVLCAARSIPKFMRDLRRIPDKVQAAMDVIMEEGIKDLREQIQAIKPFSIFAGGARSAGDFISREAFERFVWPYFKEAVEVIVEEGSIAYLHLDLCWDRFLDYFLELPKGKCIFSPDSTTDIFKAKEVLQDRMCFAGDVSPTLLALGTPDEVYEYSMRLINEIGPKGFIMAAGCCIPANAKPENVKAMVSAAENR